MESSLGYQFSNFRLDLKAEALFRDGERVTINRRTFQVLRLLVERAGEIVTKQEFFDTVWADTFVEDNSLTVAVTALRRVLGDSAKSPTFIENLPRKGYRFIAEVKVLESPARPAPIAASVDDGEGSPGARSNRRVTLSYVLLSAFLLLLLAGVFGGRYLSHSLSASQAGQIDSIAILPFENGDPESEYVSDGLSEGLINSLGTIPDLRVINRDSVFQYKRRLVDISSVGRDLSVKAVLSGRVERSDDRVKVTAELTDAQSGGRIWAREFEAAVDKPIVLRNDISDELTRVLRPTYSTRQSAAKIGTQDPLAYQQYIRGAYYWNKRTPLDINKAMALFQQAIDTDPTYAIAYVGLANCYAQAEFYPSKDPKERGALITGAAQRALEIDENFGEAYSVLGLSALYYDLDLPAAERYYKRSVELSPNYATAHHWYAEYLAMQGRFDESFYEYHVARNLDPLSFAIMTDEALNYYYARQFDRAVEELSKVKQVNPDYERTDWFLSMVYENAGRYSEAIISFRAFYAHQKNTGQMAEDRFAFYSQLIDNLERGMDRSGSEGYWRAKIENEIKLSGETGPSGWGMAKYYAKLGETDKAFLYMQRSIETRDAAMLWMKASPDFDNVRSDPRFSQALRRLGFEE